MVAEAPGTLPAMVLIAEDEPLVALFLTDMVEEQGFRAVCDVSPDFHPAGVRVPT